MEILSQVLEERGYSIMETFVYYENRPHPFSELWVNEPEKAALIIDHDICEQPVCGATWSYRDYAKKQNERSESYRWLRYDANRMESLLDDLESLDGVRAFQRVDRAVDPRKSHPQLIGRTLYQKQLTEWRNEMLRGNSIKVLVSL